MTHPTDHPPGTEAEYLGYALSKDRLCRDLEAVIAADTEEVGPSHWVAVAATAAWSVFRQCPKFDAPSNPAPDLARDDDAQSEVGGPLRERLIEAFNSAYEPCGVEAVDETHRHDRHQWSGACYVCHGDVGKLADAAMSVVQLELGSLRETNEDLAQHNRRLRSELANMTAQRDKEKRVADSLREDRDAVHELRKAERQRADLAESGRDKAYAKWSQSAKECDRIATERDTAQAEVKDLRERYELASEDANRSAYAGAQIESKLRAEVKELRERVEHHKIEADGLRAERDALQARIDWVLRMCDSAYVLEKFAVRKALTAPADDGSEAGSINHNARCVRCHAREDQPCTPGCDQGVDAENESPPFQPGDWVRRVTGGESGQVLSIGGTGALNVRWLDGWESQHSPMWIEPWQPRTGESVIRTSAVGTTRGTVASIDGGDRYVVTESDGSEYFVALDKLRPAKEDNDG